MGARIRAAREPSIQLAHAVKPDVFVSIDGGYLLPARSTILSTRITDSPISRSAYGKQPREELPNRLKRGNLDFSAVALDAQIPLGSEEKTAVTVAEIV